MSAIPCTKSKLSFGFFKTKKNKDEAQASSSQGSPAASTTSRPVAHFDAAAPLSKNFRKLSIQIDQNNAQPTPAAPTRIGLPSVDEVAVARRHSAPVSSSLHLSRRSLTKAELKQLTYAEREAYYAHEFTHDIEPESPMVALHLEPLPEDFNVKIPTTFGPAGKSILKKTRNYDAFVEQLPRINEKSPLATPRRQSTVSSAVSDEILGGGPLSRTVSFDRHTDAFQEQRQMLLKQKEIVTAFRREQRRQEERRTARTSL